MDINTVVLINGSLTELKLPAETSQKVDSIWIANNSIIRRLTPGDTEIVRAFVAPDLYQFESHTFQNCGKNGNTGPTHAQLLSAYSGTNWASNSDFFTSSSGIQQWRVPITGSYSISAVGAAHQYGRSAEISGVLYLEAGDTLYILCGQYGNANSAGCGGSFVKSSSLGKLIAAGGAGGTLGITESTARLFLADETFTGGNQYSTDYTIAGGGGGFVFNGASPGRGGVSMDNGGNGGVGGGSFSSIGGFGGGGGGGESSKGTNTPYVNHRSLGGGGGATGGNATGIYFNNGSPVLAAQGGSSWITSLASNVTASLRPKGITQGSASIQFLGRI